MERSGRDFYREDHRGTRKVRKGNYQRSPKLVDGLVVTTGAAS